LSFRELYTHKLATFCEAETPYEEASYIILGVPYDGTSTFRRGAKFAPKAIREASQEIETYSLTTKIDLEELKIHDTGDLDTHGEIKETLKRIEKIAKEVHEDDKKLIMIGGEHTISLGAINAMKNTAFISLDAHMDFRNEYLGLSVCHATVTRRIYDRIGGENIFLVGVRAVCSEEIEEAKKRNLNIIWIDQIRSLGVRKTSEILINKLKKYNNIYISVDFDVLDPAYAPAVQNPEPMGLSVWELVELLSSLCMKLKVSSLDFVEVAPNYDNGITAIVAAKVIVEALCSLEVGKRKF